MTAAPVLHFPQEDPPMTSCGCGGSCACHSNGAFPPPCTTPGGCGLQSALAAHRADRQPMNTGLLWQWVDRLTLNRTEKLRRRFPGQRKSSVEHVPVPSLWTQLEEAVASDNSGGARGKSSPGSRSPLDLHIEALMIQISSSVAGALLNLGHTPRLRDRDDRDRRADVILHDTRSDLRQLATVLVGTGEPALVARWTRTYRTWVTHAEAALTVDDESIHMRGARGRPCPCCLALWVTSERDGERFRDPALVAQFRDGQLEHLLCRACGADWRDDLDELAQWLSENEAEFGPPHLWGETVPRAEA